jgi:hypothetical protein
MGEDNDNVKTKLAPKLADAIKNFMLEQEHTITKAQLVSDLEEIKTATSFEADVKESTLMGPYSPIIELFKSFIGMLEPLNDKLKDFSGGVVTIPGIDPVIATVNLLEEQIMNQVKEVAGGGVTIRPLDLRKDGKGQGGTLTATGYTYVGDDPRYGKSEFNDVFGDNTIELLQTSEGESKE